MEEIKVGEYVRTKDGVIDKIDHYENDTKLFHCEKNHYIDPFNYIAIPSSDVKHSKNIIDLIEEGDILQINKEKYEVVYDRSYNKLGLLIPNREKLGIRHCSLQYIFSKQGIAEFKNIRVVTKEQFSNIEYRLEN